MDLNLNEHTLKLQLKRRVETI